MKRKIFLILLIVLSVSAVRLKAQETVAAAGDTLVVLWTSGDIDVAEKMVFMYASNAKRAGWFREVIFIVWGPSAKLLSEEALLQDRVKEMQESGVIVEACIACARMYGVDKKLKELGIDVKGMGVPLTSYLKRGYRVLSL